MKIDALIEGLQILKAEGAEGHCVCAEHDIIYAGHKLDVSSKAAEKLRALGWHFDERTDSWAAFT